MPNKQIHLWLSDKERERLTRLADAAGCSRSVMVRALIMGASIKPCPPAEWPELVRQVSADREQCEPNYSLRQCQQI